MATKIYDSGDQWFWRNAAGCIWNYLNADFKGHLHTAAIHRESADSKFHEKLGLIPGSYFLICMGGLVSDNKRRSDLLKDFLKSKLNRKLVIVGDQPFEMKWALSLNEN